MKITLVPSSVSERGEYQHQYLTSYVINDTLAVDAGSLGLMATPAEQKRVQHVLITHTHIDHVGSLPIFVELLPQFFCDLCIAVTGQVHEIATIIDQKEIDRLRSPRRRTRTRQPSGIRKHIQQTGFTDI